MSLSVLFLPDYTDVTPYQTLLADALADYGVSVAIADGNGGAFPILGTTLDADERPDVVHVHFLHQFAVTESDRAPRAVTAALAVRTLLELLILRSLGVTLVWTAHDLFDHERTAPRVETAFKHLALRWCIDHVFIHCPQARTAIEETYRLPRGAVSTTVTPHGPFSGCYPDTVTRGEAREQLGIDRDAFVFGFFGAIRPYKNVPRLVDAFRAMADPDDRLVIAGDPHDDCLRRVLERAIDGDERVHTRFGFVPDEEVQLYLRAADVMVLPFRTTERSLLTSGSALLSLDFDRPVVAPDVGCVGATVAAAGGFCYDGDDSLVDAMCRARAATDLPRRERLARGVAHSRTWDEMAFRTHAAYLALTDA